LEHARHGAAKEHHGPGRREIAEWRADVVEKQELRLRDWVVRCRYQELTPLRTGEDKD
jgi:hypothetical protein